MDSRLNRKKIKQGKNQIYRSLIGIVILLFLLINFGPYLISSAGRIIDTVTGKSGQDAKIETKDFEPPILDPLPAAVASAFIDITGRSFYQDGEVELFLNGSKYKSEPVDQNSDFEIKDVKLSEGENLLKVRMVKDEQKSEFSQDYKISFVNDAPKLEIEKPADRASFSKADQDITISGKTDPENTVRINDFIAITDSDGNFSYILKLKDGENRIKIVATNLAGKTSEKEIIVSYSP